MNKPKTFVRGAKVKNPKSNDKKPSRILYEGSVVLITHGEYDDFGFTGLYKVEETFNALEALDRYKSSIKALTSKRAARHDNRLVDRCVGYRSFEHWLAQQRYLTKMPFTTLHTEDFDKLRITPDHQENPAETLEDLRSAAAQRLFESYNFDPYEIESADGWEHTVPGTVMSRTIYLTSLDSDDATESQLHG